MRKMLLASLIILVSASLAGAANWRMLPTQSGLSDGAPNSARQYLFEFTADADDAGIEDLPMSNFSCCFTSIESDFDATTPPNSVSVDIKSYLGNSYTGFPTTARTTSGFSRDADSSPICISGSFTLRIIGNTTNSGKGVIGMQC